MDEQYTPYTYYICWSKTGMKYYGVRYKKGCHPNDFWISYKTSSDYVKQYIVEHGEPDIKEIRQTFEDGAKARSWESRVLTKINAVLRSDYLNKWARNIAHPELSSANMTSLRKDTNFESKRQQGLSLYNASQEAREFRTKTITERNKSEKARETSSMFASLRNHTYRTCPHCSKEFNLGNFAKHTKSLRSKGVYNV